MADIKIFNPEGLNKSRSTFLQMARVKTSELVFIAGQVSVDATGALIGKNDFNAQCAQVYANIHIALHSVGADWKNVVEFTSYLVRAQDVQPFRDYRQQTFPNMFANGAYPPNTLLVISRLADEGYLLEIKAIAAL